MNGLIILLSSALVVYTIFKTDKMKKLKYIVAPLFGVLYGFILLFVGMGINTILYYVLAVLPLIVCVANILRQDKARKK
jgi:hypothetical protein